MSHLGRSGTLLAVSDTLVHTRVHSNPRLRYAVRVLGTCVGLAVWCRPDGCPLVSRPPTLTAACLPLAGAGASHPVSARSRYVPTPRSAPSRPVSFSRVRSLPCGPCRSPARVWLSCLALRPPCGICRVRVYVLADAAGPRPVRTLIGLGLGTLDLVLSVVYSSLVYVICV